MHLFSELNSITCYLRFGRHCSVVLSR